MSLNDSFWRLIGVGLVSSVSVLWWSSARAKIVEIEWEERAEATAYEVEVYRDNQRIGTTKSAKKDLKASLPAGKFKIRGRILTKHNLKGDWSDFSDFEVPPDKVVAPEKASVTVVTANPKTLAAPVNLTWKPSVDAKFYRVFLKDSEGQVVAETRVSRARALLQVPPGVFSHSVQAEGPDGVLGGESEVLGRIEVNAAQLPKPQFQLTVADRVLKLSWTSSREMDWWLRLEHKAYFAESWVDVVADRREAGAAGAWSSSALSPGWYRLAARLRSKGWVDSPVVTREFEVRPVAADFR